MMKHLVVLKQYNLPRRDGRVVDRVGLENRRAEMPQGFESPSLLHSVQIGVYHPLSLKIPFLLDTF